MKNLFIGAMIVATLTGCSGLFGGPLSSNDLDDACKIVDKKPTYLRAFKTVQRDHGVPIAVQMAIIHQESKFVSNAKTPVQYWLGFIPAGRQSSAYGYAQALDGTWDDYRRSTKNWGARRNNIHDASDFIGWYLGKSNSKNGISLYDTKNLYLSYHEGHAGFAQATYKQKAWLNRVANRVEARAIEYHTQLRSCGMI